MTVCDVIKEQKRADLAHSFQEMQPYVGSFFQDDFGIADDIASSIAERNPVNTRDHL